MANEFLVGKMQKSLLSNQISIQWHQILIYLLNRLPLQTCDHPQEL